MTTTWEPVPLKYRWIGHLITGVVPSALTFALAAGGTRLLPYKPLDTDLQGTVTWGWLITESLSAVFDQRYAIKHQHDAPGGWAPIYCRLASCTAGHFALSYAVSSSARYASLVAASAGAAELTCACALKNWERGMSREEVRDAWKKTVEMTKAMREESRGPNLTHQ
ncbi:hypothetical protein GC425_04645 [Corynebacterium sp. zg254]|uniref:hypothetical protein n=1 Tax=Corynebacterium sp. zg254 TaxID=2656645 RepID=UPI0021513954|nr:hypothetical protein [Corynebacterium sp. zg254]MCR5914161.1 hypothetical protein [Corynebacterium sp. zg254]